MRRQYLRGPGGCCRAVWKRIALAKGSSSHYLLLGALASQGLRLQDVQPVYLGPADARAAFEAGAVDAWVVWDPYLSIAQAARPLRVLADFGSLAPAVTAPWSFYEARRDFVQAEPGLVKQLVAAIAREGAWATANPEAVARTVSPLLGLPPDVVMAMQKRVRYGAQLITPAIAADHQKVADAFAAQGLIPKPVVVREVCWVPARTGLRWQAQSDCSAAKVSFKTSAIGRRGSGSSCQVCVVSRMAPMDTMATMRSAGRRSGCRQTSQSVAKSACSCSA